MSESSQEIERWVDRMREEAGQVSRADLDRALEQVGSKESICRTQAIIRATSGRIAADDVE